MLRQMSLIAVLATCVLATGCVRRTILITSDPDGALVALNDQEIGRTPVEADFTFYGDYDVRLTLDGYEPINTVGEARAPLWDNVPFDLVAEMVPGEPHSQIHWHYDLVNATPQAEGMLERARELRPPAPPVDETEADAAAPNADEPQSDAGQPES